MKRQFSNAVNHFELLMKQKMIKKEVKILFHFYHVFISIKSYIFIGGDRGDIPPLEKILASFTPPKVLFFLYPLLKKLRGGGQIIPLLESLEILP